MVDTFTERRRQISDENSHEHQHRRVDEAQQFECVNSIRFVVFYFILLPIRCSTFHIRMCAACVPAVLEKRTAWYSSEWKCSSSFWLTQSAINGNLHLLPYFSCGERTRASIVSNSCDCRVTAARIIWLNNQITTLASHMPGFRALRHQPNIMQKRIRIK